MTDSKGRAAASRATSDALSGLDMPALSVLWATARRRVESSGLGFGSTPITLRDLTSEQLVAVCGLLGRKAPSGTTLRVDLEALDATLRSGATERGLLDVLEAIGGPLVDRQAARRARELERSELWDMAFEHEAIDDPKIESWLRRVRSTGRLTRLDIDDPAAVLDAALGLLMELSEPRLAGDPRHHLAALAAGLFGDAHALDADQPIGSLVLDGVHNITGETDRRAAWATLGIDVDSVSTSALTLNLRCPGSPIIMSAAAAGEPLRITARMLRRASSFVAMDQIFVCENPTVLAAAADELGVKAPPMVCTEGWPSTVTIELLETLAPAGTFSVRADFDVQGVAIAGFVLDRALDAIPWRFTAKDYLTAIDQPPGTGSVALNGIVAAASWDDRLAPTMNEHGVAVHEEALLGQLLGDLGA